MNKKTILLLAFLLIKFLMHLFLVNPVYDLQRDEYLHLDQANHLAWGYESVPPFTSWISFIILHLGNTVFWIKFFPALFGALTILVVWKMVEALNGNMFAMALAAIAVSCSVLPRINILYQPNSFDILCWSAFYYMLIRYVKSQHYKWLYFAAITFGIGFLNKYNIAFLIIGVIPGILLTDARKVFLNKHLYFAALIALLLISPNLLWQYNNNFPVFHHMKELAETQLVHVRRSDFLKEQLFFFFGSLFVTIAALFSFFSYPEFKKYRLFFWSFVFTITVFVYLRAKDYYAIGLYPVLLAFGSVYIEYLTRRDWKKWLRPAAILVPALIFLPFIKKIFPVDSPETITQNSNGKKHRWEDGKDHPLPQDFADMLGWKELAMKTDSAWKNISDKEHTLVLCDNYGQAGAINYYTKQKIQAVSLNADYINWFQLDKKILHVIRVKDNANDLSHERILFDTVDLTGVIENKFAREKGTAIFILSAPKTDINKLLAEEINKRKQY